MIALVVGCGFVGRPAAVRLVDEGVTVFATSRSRDRAESYRRDGITLVQGDLLDPLHWDPLPPIARVLYAVGYDRNQGVPMRQVYVDGLKRFLDRLETRVERFVYASSTSVYGLEQADWVDETTPTLPRNEAGAVVLEAEEAVRAWAASTGSRAVIVRFAGLYGPGRVIGEASLKAESPLAVDPDGWLNLLHRDDAAEVAARAFLHPDPAPIYTACDDRPITRREYYETAARSLGLREPRFEPGVTDKGRRRVANHLMKRDLLGTLHYPDISTGLPASVAEQRAATASTE